MSSGLRLSIAANIALAGIVALLLWRGQSAAPNVLASRPQPVAVRANIAKADTVTSGSQPRSSSARVTPAAVAQLEQLGMSREIIVNALLESFNRRWDKRVLELQKKYAPRTVPEREMRELSRLSDTERNRELKEALGEDGFRAWDKEQTLRTLNRARLPGDDLPMTAEEAEQAYRLQKDADEKSRELQMAMEDGVADRADIGTLQARVQETLDRELEKLLGKQRVSELRGHTDATTEVYRTYGDLNPTPEQAKAALLAEDDYRAREDALAKRLTENPGIAATITAELKALNDAKEETHRRTFGPEAYDTMKRENDPTYKTLKQYAEAWQLKDNDIRSVYETVHAFQDQAERTRTAAEMSEAAGQRVNWREINAAIEQSRLQTEAGLQNLIGSERLRRLQQNGVIGTR